MHCQLKSYCSEHHLSGRYFDCLEATHKHSGFMIQLYPWSRWALRGHSDWSGHKYESALCYLRCASTGYLTILNRNITLVEHKKYVREATPIDFAIWGRSRVLLTVLALLHCPGLIELGTFLSADTHLPTPTKVYWSYVMPVQNHSFAVLCFGGFSSSTSQRQVCGGTVAAHWQRFLRCVTLSKE